MSLATCDCRLIVPSDAIRHTEAWARSGWGGGSGLRWTSQRIPVDLNQRSEATSLRVADADRRGHAMILCAYLAK